MPSSLNRWLAAAALLCVSAVGVSAQSEEAGTCPEGVPELMKQLASIKGLSARFTEEKHMALLAAPLINEGTLLFSREGSLVRAVTKPEASVMWLSAGTLRLRDRSGERTVAASRWQAVDALVSSYLHLMGGDQPALERQYKLHVRCTGPVWHLRMVPRDASLQRIIRHMTMSGQGATLQAMEMEDGNGDRSKTVFTNVRTDVAYSESQLKKMYRAAVR